MRRGPSEATLEGRSASSLVREVAPRGLSTARAREAHRLRTEAGLTLRAIAERLGANPKTVERWVRTVREELAAG